MGQSSRLRSPPAFGGFFPKTGNTSQQEKIPGGGGRREPDVASPANPPAEKANPGKPGDAKPSAYVPPDEAGYGCEVAEVVGRDGIFMEGPAPGRGGWAFVLLKGQEGKGLGPSACTRGARSFAEPL